MVETDAGVERSINNGSSRRDQSSINLMNPIFVGYRLQERNIVYLSKCSSSAVGYRLNKAKADANNERPLDITIR